MITCHCGRDCTGNAHVGARGWECPRCHHKRTVDPFFVFLVTLAVAAVVTMVTIVVALCTRGLP